MHVSFRNINTVLVYNRLQTALAPIMLISKANFDNQQHRAIKLQSLADFFIFF